MSKKLPSARVLRRLLDYDPCTGRLFWKERPAWLFSGKVYPRHRAQLQWNTKLSGKEAFLTQHGRGYLIGGIFDQSHLAHRVAWCWYFGHWPEDQIDHINGDKGDNRISNLRAVTQLVNAKNLPASRLNTSGFRGVSFNKRTGRWRARITADRSERHLGYFASKADAVAARIEAEKEHGFHPNHGRPSCAL